MYYVPLGTENGKEREGWEGKGQKGEIWWSGVE